MTLRAIVGLIGINAVALLTGAALLCALGGARTMSRIARLVGLAYLLGIGSLIIALTSLLVVGVPFRLATIVSVVVLLGGGTAVVLHRRSLRPPGPPTWRLPELPLLAAPFVGAIGLYFLGAARSARLQGLSEFDAWWCWALQAKTISLSGGLDPAVFGSGSPRCPGYPPGLAAWEAAAFGAMGSPDVITYHLQACILLAALVAAVAGLLHGSVRSELLYPCLLAAVVLPSLTGRLTDGRADIPLGVMVAAGALLLVLWLEHPEPWQLPVAAVLFAAASLSKREGALLAGCAVIAALLATARARRASWPPLLAVVVCVGLASLPWQLWLHAHGASSGAPESGDPLSDPERVWPALRLAVQTLLDNDLWLVAAPVAVVAGFAAMLVGARRIGTYVLAFAVASMVACWLVVLTNPSLEITQDYGLNPIVRLVGTPVLVLAVITPVALQRAWQPGAAPTRLRPQSRRRRIAAWSLVGAMIALYPLSAVTGTSSFRLPGGWPELPKAELTRASMSALPLEGPRGAPGETPNRLLR